MADQAAVLQPTNGSTAARLSYLAAFLWVALIMAGALAARHLPVPPPDQIDWSHLSVTPGVAGHLLGTDGMGRDILSRLLFGARVSLVVGFFAPCIGVVLGCIAGIVAGFYRGAVEKIVVAVIDALLAFPRLVFLLMTMSVFGSSVLSLTLSLGFVCFPPFARVARAGTLRVAEREYVLAARGEGRAMPR